MRHGRRDRRVDEGDALWRLALDVGEGVPSGVVMKKKASTPPSAADSERRRRSDVRELDSAVGECLRPVGLGVANKGAYVRAAGQERVDDRSALLARPAEDGDRAGCWVLMVVPSLVHAG